MASQAQAQVKLESGSHNWTGSVGGTYYISGESPSICVRESNDIVSYCIASARRSLHCITTTPKSCLVAHIRREKRLSAAVPVSRQTRARADRGTFSSMASAGTERVVGVGEGVGESAVRLRKSKIGKSTKAAESNDRHRAGWPLGANSSHQKKTPSIWCRSLALECFAERNCTELV